MKVFVFVVLAIAVFGARADEKDVAGDVRKVITEILEKIKDPLVDVHDKSYVIDLIVEKIEADINDVVVKGVKDLDIKQLDYDAESGRLDYDLTFGDVAANVDIDLVLSGLIAVDHHPTIDVDLIDLKLAGYAVVDTSIEPNQLTDFKLLVTLGDAKVALANILNDDELTSVLSDVLNKSLPTMVDSIAVSLEPVVSPILQSAINIILRHVE